MTLDWQALAGRYEGKPCVRPGTEETLTPAEKKRFLKATERIPLEVRADATFTYKGVTRGVCRLEGDKILLQPTEVSGQTLESMQEAAAQDGRAFTLGWLFASFRLTRDNGDLVSEGESQTIYTRFSRID